jgi:hypothetical protein
LVLLAVALFVAVACTSGGQPSAGSQQPAARASASKASAAQASASQASPAQGSTSQAGTSASNGCAGQPPVSPLPVWARSGFTPADMAMPHVMGQAGDIVAILWAPRDALRSPAPQDRINKILWVSRVPVVAPYQLVIKATLGGSTRTTTATVPGGPGPSIIDMPTSGCWTFHLSWSGHTDQLNLRYVA